MNRGRTVLWGGRRGDVQYGSRDYWMTRIPIGAASISVAHPALFCPGDVISVGGESVRVVGREDRTLGVGR